MIDYFLDDFDYKLAFMTPPFLRRGGKRVYVWETKVGQEIPVPEMEDLHLLNAHRMLRRAQQEEETDYRRKWISILLAEIRRRGLKPLRPLLEQKRP